MHLQYIVLYIESFLLCIDFIGMFFMSMFFMIPHIEIKNKFLSTFASMTVMFQLLITPILAFLCIYSLSFVLKYKYYLTREMEKEEINVVKYHTIYMYFFILYFFCWVAILYFKVLPQPPS